MRAITVLVLFGATSLGAATGSLLDTGLGVGYRADKSSLTVHPKGHAFYKESDEDLQALSLDFYWDLRMWNFYWANFVDWGWYVSGKTHTTPSFDGLDGSASFSQNADGWSADVQDTLGYVFDWMTNRVGVQLIPEMGYGFFYQKLVRGNNHPEVASVGGADAMYNVAYVPFRQQWWGPLVGGKISYSPMVVWTFELGGYYHFLLHTNQQLGALEQVPGQFVQIKERLSGSSGWGQSYFAKIKAQIADSWNMNGVFRFVRCSEKVHGASDHRHMRQYLPTYSTQSDDTSARVSAVWRTFAFLCEMEYFF